MLSKFVTSIAMRRMITPMFVSIPQRGFVEKLGLESQQSSDVAINSKVAEITLWQDIAKAQETALVLKDNDQIEKYVLSLVKNYFRCTMKATVALESAFTDHGLDSLDIIELVI